MSKEIVYKKDVLDLLSTMPPEEGVTRALLIQSVKQLPSAQPERKKGKWIKISPAGIYECSKCGQNVMTSDIDVYEFCHGCGADMRGEQDDEVGS